MSPETFLLFLQCSSSCSFFFFKLFICVNFSNFTGKPHLNCSKLRSIFGLTYFYCHNVRCSRCKKKYCKLSSIIIRVTFSENQSDSHTLTNSLILKQFLLLLEVLLSFRPLFILPVFNFIGKSFLFLYFFLSFFFSFFLSLSASFLEFQ